MNEFNDFFNAIAKQLVYVSLKSGSWSQFVGYTMIFVC